MGTAISVHVACCGCGCLTGVDRRRMSTKYVNDDLNYTWQCDECFAVTQEYWADMWTDYWSMVFG